MSYKQQFNSSVSTIKVHISRKCMYKRACYNTVCNKLAKTGHYLNVHQGGIGTYTLAHQFYETMKKAKVDLYV